MLQQLRGGDDGFVSQVVGVSGWTHNFPGQEATTPQKSRFTAADWNRCAVSAMRSISSWEGNDDRASAARGARAISFMCAETVCTRVALRQANPLNPSCVTFD
jgi:hypothetical protein